MPETFPQLNFTRRRSTLAALAYRYRVWLLLAGIVVTMSILAPTFRSPQNFASVLKGGGVNLLAGIGFTVVMISGQLDLSIAWMMTLGGALTIGLQPQLGWAGSLGVALLSGVVVGLFNGLLVAKAKINSFIVTLGSMIILENVVQIYCQGKGGTISSPSFVLSDFFTAPLISVPPSRPVLAGLAGCLTPQILLPFVLLAVLAVLLRQTPVGKGFYLLGGNPQTAWYSGLRVSRYACGAFVISGVLSALGGAVNAISEANANPTMGKGTLMTVVAAAIIGGTSMQGGKGGVVGTAVALIALAALIRGLNCCGQDYEVQLLASGLVLAAVILYDAVDLHLRQRRRGQRADLLAELEDQGKE